jgi:hypothetical protein
MVGGKRKGWSGEMVGSGADKGRGGRGGVEKELGGEDGGTQSFAKHVPIAAGTSLLWLQASTLAEHVEHQAVL